MFDRSQPPRYILNKSKRRIHDRTHLTEQCNTDQLVDRGVADEQQKDMLLANGWKTCFWCRE